MPDLEPFAPDVNLVADAAALADALARIDGSPAARQRRVAIARENDWERRELEWGRLLRKAGIAQR